MSLTNSLRGYGSSKSMLLKSRIKIASLLAIFILAVAACLEFPRSVETNPAVTTQRIPRSSFQGKIRLNSHLLLSSGQNIFRFDTLAVSGSGEIKCDCTKRSSGKNSAVSAPD